MYFTFKEGKSYSANTVNQGERGEGGGRRNVSLVRFHWATGAQNFLGEKSRAWLRKSSPESRLESRELGKGGGGGEARKR